MKTSEYEQQAIDFLNKTNTKLLVRFLEHGKYFIDDKDERDIFEVKMTRGTREYIFKYGASIADYERMLKSIFGESSNTYYAENVINSKYNDGTAIKEKMKYTKLRAKMSEWNEAGQNFTPSVYGILSSLEGYCYADNVDDFANQYGYEKPSEAIRVFEAVKAQADALQKMFNDEELEELSNIS